MKILAILNESNEQKTAQVVEEMKEGNEVEIVQLMDGALSYDDLVDKIDKCDKVISW